MNAQLAPLIVGLVASCLLLRTRGRGLRPRSLPDVGRVLGSSELSEITSDGTGAQVNARVANRPRHAAANRSQPSGPQTPRTKIARIFNRTVQIRTPTGLRRWVRSSTISLKLVPLLLGAILLILAPTIAPALALCIVGVVRIRKRRSIAQLRARQCAALPDLVDMIRLCVASGCTPHGSLVVLGSLPLRADDVLGPLVANAAEGLENGAVVAEVLDELQATIGEAARPLCSALRSSADAGTPIGETLDLLAREARRTRKAQADIAAKRLPVLLLFPLITCILPAFALLAIVPLLGGALSALHW
jgi:Flp pilus assembly protein TadB